MIAEVGFTFANSKIIPEIIAKSIAKSTAKSIAMIF